MTSERGGPGEKTADLVAMGKRARAAARGLVALTTDAKNAALLAMADEIEAQADVLLAQNVLDVEAGRSRGLSPAVLDRLRLSEARVVALAEGVRAVAALPDPVGEVIEGHVLPNGLQVSRRRTPIGVLGVIYARHVRT